MLLKRQPKRIAVVTGGTRGIGLAITSALMRDGYMVAALYHDNGDAAALCEQKTGARAFQTDVADYESCHDVIAEIEQGLGPIMALVNNAGITRDGVLHKMSVETWRAVIDTNLTSCFNMCRAVVPLMRDRGVGRIVNIGSINGEKGQFGQTNYAAAKAGMIGFTKALALESAARNVTVNIICPGYIETEMTGAMHPDLLQSILRQIPAGRMGLPEEVAEMTAFLASDKAAFITGSTIAVNGGQYM